MVWRRGLWHKVVKENVNGKFLYVIRNMYRNSCVRLNQHILSTFEFNVGVRQGENVSPLLFDFYVIDVESYLMEHNIVTT